jgi:hypothetical protein
VLFLEWDFGNRDFGPIAARVKDAKPDLVWVGAIGLEGNMLLDAMKKIDYVPPQHFYLYPAPGPDDQVARSEERAVAVTIFEEHAPFTNNPVAAEFVKISTTSAPRPPICLTPRSRCRPPPRTRPGRSWRPACVVPTAWTTRPLAGS